MLETRDHVQQFLTLQNKNETELRALCEGTGLDTEGKKEELIDRLLTLGLEEQSPVFVAQAIPLRTRDNNAQPLDAAIEAMRKWRKMIFEAKGNRKQFQLLNGKGKAYTANLKYIRCSTGTLQRIINDGWYLPLEKHSDLIGLLRKEPDAFTVSIIQKPDGQGNSWLMLHICPKSQAA